MTIRRATEADREVIERLWLEFSDEAPPPPWVDGAFEGAREEIAKSIEEGTAILAEDAGTPAGFAYGLMRSSQAAELTDLYVRPEVRRRGTARKLVREFVSAVRGRGAEVVSVTVGGANDGARRFYDVLGFRPHLLTLVGEVETLTREPEPAGSFGSIHVQSDDVPAVERAVRQFVPRLPGRSRGSVVVAPRNGWTAVYDELADREPEMRRRLARELSARMGAVVVALGVEEDVLVRYVLFDRGQVVDEYLSVPEFHGALPPGDVIALAANPRVIARLTGADPARVRDAAPTAASPGELPAAPELLQRLADAIGIEGGGGGYDGATDLPGATRIERA